MADEAPAGTKPDVPPRSQHLLFKSFVDGTGPGSPIVTAEPMEMMGSAITPIDHQTARPSSADLAELVAQVVASRSPTPAPGADSDGASRNGDVSNGDPGGASRQSSTVRSSRRSSIVAGNEETAAVAIQSLARLRIAQEKLDDKRKSAKAVAKNDALVALFTAVDRNNDGSVTRVELTRALHERSESGVALQQALCKMLGLPKAVSGPYAREVFNEVFSCVDADNTAEITLDELRTFVEDLDHLRDMHADATAQEGDPTSAGLGLIALADAAIEGQGVAAEGSSLSLLEVLRAMDVAPTGELNHMEMIYLLNRSRPVRWCVGERRRLGIVRAVVERIEVFDVTAGFHAAKKLAKSFRAHVEARRAEAQAVLSTSAVVTEEEELDAALLATSAEGERSLEEREQRASDAYWERRADMFMLAADSHARNQELSRAEVASFVVGNEWSGPGGRVSDDDRWFVSWLTEGSNFSKYDADNSGTIDLSELRTAVKDWARFAKADTLRRQSEREALVARKALLRSERAEALADADTRAAEIISACTVASKGADTISVLVFMTHLLPVPRYRAFASWILKDNCAVFKRHDKDKSGTIDLNELQAALDEYFDQVASEFDQLKGSGGRVQKRADRLKAAAAVQQPPPPLVKASASGSVTFEWQRLWLPHGGARSVRLGLQSVKVTATTEAEASALEAAGPVRWTTLHWGLPAPRATIDLTDPAALYLFRTVVLDEEAGADEARSVGGCEMSVGVGDEQPSPEQPSPERLALAAALPPGALRWSPEVFWLSQPAAPTVCGLGRNALASWRVPVLPPSLAFTLKAPLPVWRLHVTQPARRQTLKRASEDRVTRCYAATETPGMTPLLPVFERVAASAGGSRGLTTTVTIVDPLRSWTLVRGLDAGGGLHEVALSVELPAGHSSVGLPCLFDSAVPPPTAVAARDAASLLVALPAPVDATRALAAAEERDGAALSLCRLEELSPTGAWGEVSAARLKDEGAGTTRLLAKLSGLPPDTVVSLRSRSTIDLTQCCRYGDGPIVLASPDEGRPNLVALGGMPPLAFGAASVDDEEAQGPDAASYVYAGASMAKSRAFRSLHASLRTSPPPPEDVFEDYSLTALACLLPSALAFNGDAADFGAPSRSKEALKEAIVHADALERLTVTMARPSVGSDRARYCCDVLDQSGGAGVWRRAYAGKSPQVDLCSSRLQLPPHLRPEPGRCLLLRSGVRFASEEESRRPGTPQRLASRPGTPSESRPGTAGAPRQRQLGGETFAAPPVVSAARDGETQAAPLPAEWCYGPEVPVVLCPLPPTVAWADDHTQCAVLVSWDPNLDLSRLPPTAEASVAFHPTLFTLEMASGQLLSPGQGQGPHALTGPLGDFQEVASSLRGPARLHSGPLAPGGRFAFRLRVETPHGSAASAPFYVETRPSVPLAPTRLTATDALFRSATGREAPFAQLKWRAPPHQGLPVDRYHLQKRRLPGGVPAASGGGWATVYLGPHRVTGDRDTMVGPLGLAAGDDSEVVEYRVRAGSLIGWGEWSLTTTFSRHPTTAPTAGAPTDEEGDEEDWGRDQRWEPCTVQSTAGGCRVDMQCSPLEATALGPCLRVWARGVGEPLSKPAALALSARELAAALGSVATARDLVAGLLSQSASSDDAASGDASDHEASCHRALVAALAPSLRVDALTGALSLASAAELARLHLEGRIVARVAAALPFPLSRSLVVAAVRSHIAHALDGLPLGPLGPALESLAAAVQAAAASELAPRGLSPMGLAGGEGNDWGRERCSVGTSASPMSLPVSSPVSMSRSLSRAEGGKGPADVPLVSPFEAAPGTATGAGKKPAARPSVERPFTPTVKPSGMPYASVEAVVVLDRGAGHGGWGPRKGSARSSTKVKAEPELGLLWGPGTSGLVRVFDRPGTPGTPGGQESPVSRKTFVQRTRALAARQKASDEAEVLRRAFSPLP